MTLRLAENEIFHLGSGCVDLVGKNTRAVTAKCACESDRDKIGSFVHGESRKASFSAACYQSLNF